VNHKSTYFKGIIAICILLLSLGTKGAIKNSNEFISCAESMIGKIYEDAKPDMSSECGNRVWVEPIQTDEFDCSGLVSYCAGLRTKYKTDELANFVSTINWNEIRAGDMLLGSGHIVIVTEKYVKDNVDMIRVVHAANHTDGVVGKDYELNNSWIQSFDPVRFKTDSKGPEVKIENPENGAAFCGGKPSVRLSITDNVEPSNDIYRVGNLQNGSNSVCFRTSRTASAEGTYTVSWSAEDWANNKSTQTKPFSFRIGKECPDPKDTCAKKTIIGVCCKSAHTTYTCEKTGYCKPHTTYRLGWAGDCRPWDFVPDENMVVSDFAPNEPYNYDSDSRVGVLSSGYDALMMSYLDHLSIKYRSIDPFEDLNDPELARRLSILIVPTGGLPMGENSDIFKSYLETYVRAGGTLIVFAQMEGVDFNVLPEGDKFIANGYLQDISCFSGGVSLSERHPIISSEDYYRTSISLDGDFESYPDGSKVLLVKQSGNAAILTYQYGDGNVVVSSMFPDFIYHMAGSLGWSSIDEKHFVRDMITWGILPAQLPEYSSEYKMEKWA